MTLAPLPSPPHAPPDARAGGYESFVSTLGTRDRENVKKHVAACEGEALPQHVALWKRLACALARFSPLAVQTAGQRALQFFSRDGNYRIQVFALEDPRDGTLLVYARDALDAAIGTGVLRGPVTRDGEQGLYEVCEQPGATLRIEVLTAAKTMYAPDYYRHLLGWNRRAIKVILPTSADTPQVRAVETLCRLAAQQVTDSQRAGL